jgi:putative aldouronate transport system substrate-binding protein
VDTTPIRSEVAQCTSVYQEYAKVLSTGSAEVEPTLEAFNAKLKAAGVDVIIAEVQRQIDAWAVRK